MNPIPFKVSSYLCVHCQLGRTKVLETIRRVYFDTEKVVSSILAAIQRIGGKLDFVTFMGGGEPTLSRNLGEMARGLRDVWDGKIALITNGYLFFKSDVRQDALEFDVVSLTIASGDERTFRMMHRPHKLR